MTFHNSTVIDKTIKRERVMLYLTWQRRFDLGTHRTMNQHNIDIDIDRDSIYFVSEVDSNNKMRRLRSHRELLGEREILDIIYDPISEFNGALPTSSRSYLNKSKSYSMYSSCRKTGINRRWIEGVKKLVFNQ